MARAMIAHPDAVVPGRFLPLTRPEWQHLRACDHADCAWCDQLWPALLRPAFPDREPRARA